MTVHANDAHPFPIYNARFRVRFPILDADGDLVTGATGLDSEASQDSGTFADVTNEATEIATSSGIYYLDLINTETDTTSTELIIKTSSSGAKTTFISLSPVRMPVLRTGTAQAGAGTTITLDSNASAKDDFYVGCYVNITNNSPANAQGQCRLITDYVGSTKVATVATWGTNPSSASTFEILMPPGRAGVLQWGYETIAETGVTGVPEVDITHIAGSAVSTTTAQLGVNVVQISGDGTSADNLESYTDGTTPMPVNVTQISGDATAADNAEADYDGTGYNKSASTIGTATAVTTVNGLAANVITAASIATGAIDADAIADNAIDAGAIAADAITAAKIADNAIDAGAIASSAITAAKFDANAITSTVLAANSITSSQLATSAVTEIQTGLATSAQVQGLVLVSNTAIGSTGNSTTALHLDTLTYGDDEINSHLLVIFDVSESEYHARWITDWVNATKLATVATLPFTPANATDTYWLLSIRADVTGGSGLDAAGVRAAVGLASANLDTQLSAIDDLIDTEVAAIKTVVDAILVDTGTDGVIVASINTGAVTADAIAANAIGASELATDAVTEIVNAVLTTQMTEAYNSDGSAPTLAQALFVITQMLTEMSISGTTMTIKKLDGSTTALTLTLNDASSPTSVTRSG